MFSQTGVLFMAAQQFIHVVGQAGAAKSPALTAESSWGDVFGFLCLGLVIVLATLASLSIFCAVIGFFFKRIDAAKQAQTEAGKSKKTMSPSLSPLPDAVDSSHIPVIAAAVAVILENHHYRIARIAPSRGMEPWAQEGRRQIFAGHNQVRYH